LNTGSALVVAPPSAGAATVVVAFEPASSSPHALSTTAALNARARIGR
jgi:hypothetical protein